MKKILKYALPLATLSGVAITVSSCSLPTNEIKNIIVNQPKLEATDKFEIVYCDINETNNKIQTTIQGTNVKFFDSGILFDTDTTKNIFIPFANIIKMEKIDS